MKIDINNTTLNPFLTSTYPEMFNLPSTSKVCLVGNSGLMKTKEWGVEIDDYDVVVRFNHAPTDGYENYVGSKTTIRLVNGHCFGGTTKVERNPSANSKFLPTLPAQDIICKTWNVEEFMLGVFNNVNKHNLFFINPQFIMEASKYTPGQEPTAGFVMLMLLLSKFSNISMYGFTFWEDGYDYHYFEKVPLAANDLGHDFNSERDIIQQLSNDNKIKIHKL
jgi:hypothetical protein